MHNKTEAILMKCLINISIFISLLFVNNSFSQSTTKTTNEIQANWIAALKNSNLKIFYSKESGLLVNDTLYNNLDDIIRQTRALSNQNIESYTTLKTSQLRENQKIEIGEYYTKRGKIYSSIIGWKKGDKWIKEFEAIYEKDSITISQTNLADNIRGKWEKYANQHRPDLIVKDVSTMNCKYFNRGKLYEQNEIIEAYSYMKKGFNIKLKPLHVRQINEDTIFEIGSFQVKGNGLYLFILRKEDEKWKLLLDFNF